MPQHRFARCRRLQLDVRLLDAIHDSEENNDLRQIRDKFTAIG
jgi:hypothetical protein